MKGLGAGDKIVFPAVIWLFFHWAVLVNGEICFPVLFCNKVPVVGLQTLFLNTVLWNSDVK